MDHFMNQFKSYEKGAHRIEAWTLLGGLAAHAPDVAFAIIMNLNVKSRTKSSLASMMTKKGKEASFPHSLNNSLAENRGFISSF